MSTSVNTNDLKATQTITESEESDFSHKCTSFDNNVEPHQSASSHNHQIETKVEMKATKGFENIPIEWYSFFRVFNENTNRYSTSFNCKFDGCNKVFTKK